MQIALPCLRPGGAAPLPPLPSRFAFPARSPYLEGIGDPPDTTEGEMQ